MQNNIPEIDELCANIWLDERFVAERNELERAYVERERRASRDVDIGTAAVARLLTAAGHFSLCADPEKCLAAYKIALQSHALFGDDISGVRDVASAICSRLGNFIAVSLIAGEPNAIPHNTSLSIAIEMADRIAINTRVLTDGRSEYLSDFQFHVLNALHQGQSISMAAPTSAGKSHVLELYLRETLRRHGVRIGFIVPTRALISQVERNLRVRFPAGAPEAPLIMTAPVDVAALSNTNRVAEVYVFTQERLHLFREMSPAARFDLVIVDEAQSIEDSDRGVLLGSVVEDVQQDNSSVQLVFSMPFVSNPEVFDRLFGTTEKRIVSLSTKLQQVAQNFFSVSFNGKTLRLRLLPAGASAHDVGTFSAAYAPQNVQYKKLAAAASVLGEGRSNLLYAPGPEDAENTAKELGALRAAVLSDEDTARARRDLSAFLSENIHQDYVVARSVMSGVGCHYGPMPSLARVAMENAFKDGTLTYLVTTLTLLYGVNLPARNIFVLKASKGNDELSQSEFWNLIGRAGRLSKELDGNVFLVDYDSWDTPYLNESRERDITPAAMSDVGTDGVLLASYIENRGASESRPGFAGTALRLLLSQRDGTLDTKLKKLTSNGDIISAIKRALGVIADDITLPSDVLRSSANINPFRQQALFDCLHERATSLDAARGLMPLAPWMEGAKGRLYDILDTSQRVIEQKENREYVYLATMAWQWMRGIALPAMIDAYYKERKKKAPGMKIGTAIRGVLRSIETDIGYRCVRYISCYSRVLKYALSFKYPELVERVADLSLYLELGASTETMLNCMKLGLSRITACRIATETRKNKMSIDELLHWFSTTDFERIGFGQIVQAEIMDVLKRRSVA